jgi:hypothetical protein
MILARWDNHDRCSDMKASTSRTLLASVAGRITVSLVMLLPFRLNGFGWHDGGIPA